MSNDHLQIHTQSLQEGIPRFYSIEIDDKVIKFFLVKIDGKIASYVDACLQCHPYKSGYYFDEGVVVCRLCKVRYPVRKLEEGLGSCVPLKIEGREANGYYMISKESVKGVMKYF